MRRRPPSDRIAAGAAVLILHLFIMALLIRADRPSDTARSEDEHVGILYLLSLSQPVRRSAKSARLARQPRRRRARPAVGLRMPIPGAPPHPSEAISVPSGPKVDWNHEAEVVAHTITVARGTGAHPGSGEHEHSPYHKCGPSPGFAWDPEPKKAGFIGLMPYLRTKRCFITLTSFGCFIGQLPPPNGQLLDPVKDGPAVFDSVPDDDNCDSD